MVNTDFFRFDAVIILEHSTPPYTHHSGSFDIPIIHNHLNHAIFRSTCGKLFPINGGSPKNTYIPGTTALSDKSQSASSTGPFEVKLEDRRLPAVPTSTKNPTSPPFTLPHIVAAVEPCPLPWRKPTPSSPTDVKTPPGPEGSAVSQAFVAGTEHA